MSFLTKLFVVLHVVLTMLFVAATIVWVNRVEEFNTALERRGSEAAIAQRQAQNAQAEAATAQSDAKAVQAQAAAEVARIRQELNTGQSDQRDLQTQLAGAQQNLSSADARLQAATAALQTAQKSNALLQEQLSSTRLTGDKTQQQNTELLTANSDLTSRLQIGLRQLRNANEQIETLQTQMADAAASGRSPNAIQGVPLPGPTPSSEVSINGIVRDLRNINGVNYATISVGSADNVAKDMVFNVIDRDAGDFLGYLTVDRVEQNEATGRLEGPRVADIKPGNEVRTQL